MQMPVLWRRQSLETLHPLWREVVSEAPAAVKEVSFPGCSDGLRRWLVGTPLDGGQAAVVVQGGNVLTCSSCSSSKVCSHTKQVQAQVQGTRPANPGDIWRKELAEKIESYLDPETGKLKVKSVSKVSAWGFLGEQG